MPGVSHRVIATIVYLEFDTFVRSMFLQFARKNNDRIVDPVLIIQFPWIQLNVVERINQEKKSKKGFFN